jgi:glucose/arabinose dehydrogenase
LVVGRWFAAWAAVIAQTPRAIPRPPAQAPGPPRPEDGSAAPDGYSPIPEWLGQTRAPRPATSAAYDVETVAEGFAGAFSFNFLPDARIIVAERPGRIKIVGKDGKVSAPIDGLPSNLWARGGQGLFDARPDRAFATNRTLYLSYTVLPEGADEAALPRSPGVLMVASAKLSADDRRLENLKVLLNAEGTGGRVIQAPDGTLLITSTIPAGLGILSVDWPQPQQLESSMGKVLRINADGSIPKDNPFAGRAGAHAEIYALGFRDVQGVTIHPHTGTLWTSEHGPRGGDEINTVGKGRNYGSRDRLRREYTGKRSTATRPAARVESRLFLDAGHRTAGIGFTLERCSLRQATCSGGLVGKALVRLVLKTIASSEERR